MLKKLARMGTNTDYPQQNTKYINKLDVLFAILFNFIIKNNK